MADNIYVLDLWVTGADAVSFNDDGTGNDTIRVNGVYSATIDIHLGSTVVDGVPINSFSRYVSSDNKSHQLVINGLIENAFGSNGSELITGNELDNVLGGDQRRFGAGLADTLLGGFGDDNMFGGSGDDSLEGNEDNDVLYGDAGNDALMAGAGMDTVMGGAGADRLDGGGDAGDTLTYAGSRAGVRLSLSTTAVTVAHGGDAEGDRLSGFDDVITTGGRDRIVFTDKANLPLGVADNMVRSGGSSDFVALGGGNDRAYGGLGNDLVFGENGDDRLSGDGGNDMMRGGFGRDLITGGAGADRFVFALVGESAVDRMDVITDFNSGARDKIDLRFMDADTTRGGNQAFHLISGAFTDAAGEVQVTVQGADLVVAGDRNGDGVADFALVLQGVTTIGVGDFIL